VAMVDQAQPPNVASADDKVAIGADGFLFHRYDDAFEQLCGAFTLSPRQAERWASMLEMRHAWCRVRGIGHFTYVVPEKHVIYDDKLPPEYRIAADRPVRRILQTVDPHLLTRIVYPEDALRAGREVRQTYHRTDVHWTNYGAFLGYKELERLLSQRIEITPIAEAELEQRVRRGSGDLGMLLDTEPDEEIVVLTHPRAQLHPRLLGNQAFKAGQVEVYESVEPRDLPRAVLFRDSNATPWLPYLCPHLSRLVVVASSRFFYDVVRSERPDVVIMEVTERYLARRWPHGSEDSIVFPEELHERDFADFTGVALPLPTADEDVVVRFDSHDGRSAFQGEGWSGPEQKHTWTIGKESRLSLPLRPGRRPSLLKLWVWPCIPPGYDRSQRLEVVVNGVSAGTFELNREVHLSCPIPADCITEAATLHVTFHHPDCVRPSTFGQNDERELAIAFREVKLSFN
jgi:alginate O-acetyltransferase complex protein AlgJ